MEVIAAAETGLPESGWGRAFGEASDEALRGVRASVIEVLGALDLASVRPATLARRLGVEKTLAWRLSKFVQAADPMSAFRHLPGTSGMEIVLKAAEDAGVAEAPLESARQSLVRLEKLIDTFGGDRTTFRMLVDHHARDGRDQVETERRKQLFRAASGVWGVQAHAQTLLTITAPSTEAPGRLDLAHVSGFDDLQRLRPDQPWVIRRNRYGSDDVSDTWTAPKNTPLEPDGLSKGDPPLMRSFSSKGLPSLHSFDGGDGFQYHELPAGPVGKGGAVTCYMGEIVHGAVSDEKSPGNEMGLYRLTVRTPVELVLFDMVLHKSVRRAGPPRAALHSLYEGRPPRQFDDPHTNRLPMVEEIQSLGSPPIFATPHLPGHAGLAATVFERAGWDPNEFEAWRIAMRYPPAPCAVTIAFDLA